MSTTFFLASRSPQRKTILEEMGVPHEVVPSSFDEEGFQEDDPAVRAVRLAEEKAKVVAADHPDRWVIGVDTLVVSQDGELLEKPVDAEDAKRMLRLHSGRTSTIHSGIALLRNDQLASDLSTAQVTFNHLDEDVIEWWIETGLWNDRSGAFQIDGEGHDLIASLEGEFETVVGFPVALFKRMCQDLSIDS